MNMRTVILYAVLSVAIALLVGCAREDDTAGGFSWIIEEGTGLPGVNPLKVGGDIQIAGSSTVLPLAEALASRFGDEGYGYNLTIDSIGSGAGFERFCVAGESDIANASRPIKDSEVESCDAVGREPIEIRIGTDALAIVVNPDNDWASNASVEELAELFTAELWSDVNSAWPNEPIERFIPGTDSGTFDYFVEEIFDEDSEPLLTSPNIQFSEDDNVLARGISGSRFSIGFFGFAYYIGNADTLKILDIDGIEANSANVNNNSYPLARPLFMYSDASVIRERPQVGAFLAYVLNYVNEEIEEVGYFKATDADIDEAKRTLNAIFDEVRG